MTEWYITLNNRNASLNINVIDPGSFVKPSKLIQMNCGKGNAAYGSQTTTTSNVKKNGIKTDFLIRLKLKKV